MVLHLRGIQWFFPPRYLVISVALRRKRQVPRRCKTTHRILPSKALHHNLTDSKLIRQITAMDGRERERLRQFVASPYFNRHRATEELLAFILKELGKKRPKLDEARTQGAMDGVKAGMKLADLQSALMKLVNKFLAVEQLQAEDFREEVLTLKRTRELQRFSLLENRGKRLDRKVARHPFRDGDTHLAAYEWKSISGYRQAEANRKDTREMQSMLDHLDRFYIVEKLRHACRLTANMMVMNTHYDLLFVEPILAYLASDEGKKLLDDTVEPSIDCYYHILHSLREPDDVAHYDRMLFYLDESLDRLPDDHQRDLYGFASNYCIGRIMTGHAAYRRNLLELYRRGLSTGIIYTQGEIGEFDYKNIVTLGAALGEYEWTESFIEDNRERLPARERDNAYAYNKANYLYSRQRYDEASRLLFTVSDSDVKIHLSRVLLEVRIAYDQEDQESALNLLENLRLYVMRNRNVSTKDKKGYNNFIRYTKQLVNLKHQRGFMGKEAYGKKMTALREAVGEADSVYARAWLVRELGS